MFGTREKIGYARSKALAIFVILDVDKKDACDILHCIEQIDGKYGSSIDIERFCMTYCAEWDSPFAALWNKYETTLDCKRKAEVNNAVPAADFICFIILVMTLSDHDMAKFVYFLWFHFPNVKPTEDTLFSCLDDIWGTKVFQSKSLGKYTRVLRKILKKNMGLDKMAFRDFRSLDWRTGGAFIMPLFSMQKQLKFSMIGAGLWSRVSVLLNAFILDPKDGLRRMADGRKKKKVVNVNEVSSPTSSTSTVVSSDALTTTTPDKRKSIDASHNVTPSTPDITPINSPSGSPMKKPKPSFKLLGDRKQARQELKLFLQLLNAYTQMPLHTDDDLMSFRLSWGEWCVQVGKEMGSLCVRALKGVMGVHSSLVAPSGDQAIVLKYKLKQEGIEQCDKVKFELQRHDALYDDDAEVSDRVVVQESVDELRERAELRREQLLQLLEEVKGVMAPIPSPIHQQGGAAMIDDYRLNDIPKIQSSQ